MKTKTNGTQIVEFLTIEQVLHGLPISRRTLDRYVAKGELRAYKLDGKIVFNPADIEQFLKSRSTGGSTPAAPVLNPTDVMSRGSLFDLEPAPAGARILSDDQAKYFWAAIKG
jgi:excisionase family DNA binding protein